MKKIKINDCICHSKIKNHLHIKNLILSEIEAAQENCGYNFSNNEVCDLYDTGIIDPAKVTRVALQNAASVSSSLILANFAIVQTE